MRGPSEKNAQYWECAIGNAMISLAAMRGSRVAVFFSSMRGCAGSEKRDDFALVAQLACCIEIDYVYIFPFMPQAITPVSFACILIGVLLNASAQLLLKAGVNAVGAFAFTRANIV